MVAAKSHLQLHVRLGAAGRRNHGLARAHTMPLCQPCNITLINLLTFGLQKRIVTLRVWHGVTEKGP
jgi:hypothetical protein